MISLFLLNHLISLKHPCSARDKQLQMPEENNKIANAVNNMYVMSQQIIFR